jgi:hypothetical protein
MPLTLSDCADALKSSIGFKLPGNTARMVQQAGEFLCSANHWNWLNSQSVSLDLVSGQEFVYLPLGIHQPHACVPVDGFENGFDFTDMQTVVAQRISTITSGQLNYCGALNFRPKPIPNAVSNSSDFSKTVSWVTTGSVTITPGQSDPFGGEDASKLAVTASTDKIRQTVPLGRVVEGSNVLSFDVKYGDLEDPSIVVKDAASGANTLVDLAIDLSGPVGAVTDSGAGDYDPTIEHVYDGWLRVTVRFLYAEADDGQLGVTVDIFPGGSSGYTLIYNVQLNAGNKVMPRYVTGEKPNVPREPVPVLEVYPTPTADKENAFTLYFRGGWSQPLVENDALAIPVWLEMLFLEMLRAVARGTYEEDEGTISERLAAVVNGPVFLSARKRDLAISPPDIGPLRNTAISMANVTSYRGLRSTVADPS